MADEKKLVLEATDVSIIFGGLCAVSDFSCELREGGLYGLIGPNGAGKTTLFNMISGIYTPTSGQLSFGDKNGKVRIINKMKPASRAPFKTSDFSEIFRCPTTCALRCIRRVRFPLSTYCCVLRSTGATKK